jgi:hypothetical protein
MHVVQTAGDPPNWGKTIRAMIGWTRNRRVAASVIVTAKSSSFCRVVTCGHRADSNERFRCGTILKERSMRSAGLD